MKFYYSPRNKLIINKHFNWFIHQTKQNKCANACNLSERYKDRKLLHVRGVITFAKDIWNIRSLFSFCQHIYLRRVLYEIQIFELLHKSTLRHNTWHKIPFKDVNSFIASEILHLFINQPTHNNYDGNLNGIKFKEFDIMIQSISFYFILFQFKFEEKNHFNNPLQ